MSYGNTSIEMSDPMKLLWNVCVYTETVTGICTVRVSMCAAQRPLRVMHAGTAR